MRITVDMWQHQNEMIDFTLASFEQRGFCWLIAGCRTGKTLAALKIAEKKNFKRTLVITKKAAISSAWQSDMTDFVQDVDYVYLDDKTTSRDRKAKKMNSKQKSAFLRDYIKEQQIVVVVNYKTARLIVDTLKELQFDYVVLDESHMVKSHNSQVSVELAKKLHAVPHKLIMTGTAWDDRPTDVYGQVRFLDANPSGRYPSSKILGTWTAFFEKHVDYWMNNHIPIPRGYKNIDNIHAKIDDFSMRIDTDDVLDLPSVRTIDIKLTMPPKMKRAYNDLEQLMVAEIGDDLLTVDHALTMGMRLHQLTGGYYVNEQGDIVEYLEDKDNPKLQALTNIVEEIDGKPMVVFTRFKHDVVLIERAMNKLGVSTAKLTGDVQQHVEWQREGKGQILIANIQAGGTGVTLSRARYATYYSLGHSRTDFTQSQWRIRDNNSDKNLPIVYHNLLIENSIDMLIRSALASKKSVSDELLAKLSNRLTTA